MIHFAQYLPFLFVLIILPDKREAFVVTPWRHNKLRKPASHSLFIAYEESLAPPGGGDDRQESYEWNDERRQQPLSPREQEPGTVNGSYRVDVPGSAHSNGVPQQGFHKQAPYNNGFQPSDESFSDPWSGSAPVNVGQGGKSIYRERTGAVSSAHNRKGPPLGSFAPPPMRMGSDHHRSHASAHNGRDVRPWNSQRRIDHSFADNLLERSPHRGDASLSTRYRHQEPAYESEGPIDDEYLDAEDDYLGRYDPPPQHVENRRYQPYQTFERPAQPGEPVTASYFAPETPDSTDIQSDTTTQPVENSGLTHQQANGVGQPNEITVAKPNGTFDHWQSVQKANGASNYDARTEVNVPTTPNSVEARVVVSVSNGVQGPPVANGASDARHSDVHVTMPDPDSYVSNGAPSPGGEQEPPLAVAASTPNPPMANGASSAKQNDVSAPPAVAFPHDTANGSSPIPGATPAVNGLQPPTTETINPVVNGAMGVAQSNGVALAPGSSAVAATSNGTPSPVADSMRGQAAALGAMPFSDHSMDAPTTVNPPNLNNDQVPVSQSWSATVTAVPSTNNVSVTNQCIPVADAPAVGVGSSSGGATTVPPTPTIGAARIERRDTEHRVQEPTKAVAETKSIHDSTSQSPPAAVTNPDVNNGYIIPQTAAQDILEESTLVDRPPSAAADASAVAQPAGTGTREENAIAAPPGSESSRIENDDSVANMPYQVAANPTVNGVVEPYKPKNGKSLDAAQSTVLQEDRPPQNIGDTTVADVKKGTIPDQPVSTTYADTLNGVSPISEDSSSTRDETLSKQSVNATAYFIEGLESSPEVHATDSVSDSEDSSSDADDGVGAVKDKDEPVGSFLGKSGGGSNEVDVSKPKAPAKKEKAAVKNPVEAAAKGMSSFLSSLAGKRKQSGNKSKKAPLKPTPPKTPPPASVATVAKPTENPKTSDTSTQDDATKVTQSKATSLSEGIAENDDDKDELTLEERIAATIADAKEINVSASKQTFESTRENLESFKSRTQSRLDSSSSKREEAEKKLADIKARMEAEARAIEEQLAEELGETQAKIDQEVAQIMNLLATEKALEAQREDNMVQLMDSLQEFIAAKEYDIAKEKNITKEVMEVRSKLKDGTIADNLDNLVEQKLSAVLVEQELVNDLFEFLIDLQDLADESRDRTLRITQILDEFHQPDTESSTPYDWKDIEGMELVLEQAAENVKIAEERIREISQRIDNAFVSRAMVLGEDVPAGLAKTAERAAGRSAKRAESFPELDLELDVENFTELKSKNEKELFGLFAKSVGSATFDGSKAAAYGIKAIVDTVTGEPAAEAASQIAKAREEQASQDSDSIVESRDATKNKVVDTVKSTATVLGSVGKAGTTIAKGIVKTDSAHVAGEALKDTTKELATSLETAAALGAKLFNSTVHRMEERKDKNDPP